jgi:tight adherence protein B
MNRLLTQLPDAFDLKSRCIRAGQTMSQALQAVTDEFDAPISAEFSLAFEQMNLGLPPEVAMRDLARRTGLLELKVFVLAMLIQTQTGGNLAEMLDKLSAIIRERSKIKGKLSALTAEGRLQAIILLALPPGLFLILLAINRPYAEVLLAHPILLVAIGVMELMGALWIRRIVNFDF